MGNYNIPADYDGPAIPHRILCRSGWEGCPGYHEKTWQVQECFAAKRDGAWPCSWLIQLLGEDGYYTVPCGRPTRYTDKATGAYECLGGHDFIPAQTRSEEGWEYAEDDDEAAQLAKAGVEPRTLTGQLWPR
jgi:hypothetical protein